MSALLRRAPACALVGVAVGVAPLARAQSSASPVAALVVKNGCAAEVQSAGDSVARPLGANRTLRGGDAVRCTRSALLRLRVRRALGDSSEIRVDSAYGWWYAVNPPSAVSRELPSRPLHAKSRAPGDEDALKRAFADAPPRVLLVAVQAEPANGNPVVDRLRGEIAKVRGARIVGPNESADIVAQVPADAVNRSGALWLLDRAGSVALGPLAAANFDQAGDWLRVAMRNRWLMSLAVDTSPGQSGVAIDHLALGTRTAADVADEWYQACAASDRGPVRPPPASLSIAAGDLLGFSVRAPARALHYHIVQIAADGALSILFPRSPSVSNAVPVGGQRCLVVAAAGRSGTVEQFIVLATPQPAPALWDLQGVTLPDWMVEPSPAKSGGSQSPRLTAHALSVRVRQP